MISKIRVLHYRSYYLKSSETFISRIVNNHRRYHPIIATTKVGHFTDGLTVYSPSGFIDSYLNNWALKFNTTPPVVYKSYLRENPGVLHAHFGIDGYRLLDFKKKYNVPVVVGFYGSDVSRLPYEKGWMNRYKKLASEVDRFIVPTFYMRNKLCELGFSEKKIKIVRFGIDINEFNYNYFPKHNNKVVMVGRFVEKKGFEHGIRALKLLNGSYKDIGLDIIGFGELETSLKSLVSELKLENRVNFLGFFPNMTIRDSLSKYLALIAPSVQAADGDTEGLPNTIIEAMACGTPVIATNHVGIPELITDNVTGLLSQEKDSEQIAGNIIKLASESKIRKYVSEMGRKKIESEFDIRVVIDQLEYIYDQMVSE